MTFMHSQDALSAPRYNKLVKLRHILGFVCVLLMSGCYLGIYRWNGHSMIEALATHSCSDDLILQGTFKAMKLYLDGSQE